MPAGDGEFAGGPGVGGGQPRPPLTEHLPRAVGPGAEELAGGDEQADRPAEAGAIVEGAAVAGVNGGGRGPAVGARSGRGGGDQGDGDACRVDVEGDGAGAGLGR